MLLGNRQEATLTQRQGLGLVARQSVEVLVLAGSELAALLDQRAAENPFLESIGRARRRGLPAADCEGQGPGLFGHVLAAIPLLTSSGDERAIAYRLADGLAETGLMVETLPDIAAELGLPVARVAAVLQRLQRIEPAGLFARTVKECLALQLSARGQLDEAAVVLLSRLEQLAEAGAAEFARRHGLDLDRLERLLPMLARLSRTPADVFGDIARPVWPDLAFRRGPDGWQATPLAEATPRLSLRAGAYEQALSRAQDARERADLRRKWHEAQSLRQALDTRQATLSRLGAILAADQAKGLDSGFVILAPLTRREVAQRLGLHESTVGRMVQNCAALVGGQSFALTRFFERPHRRHAAEGRTRSAVLAVLRNLLETETPAAVLGDDDLARRLAEVGLPTTRRRVAKYRKLLGIPAAHRRRTLGRGRAAAPSQRPPDPAADPVA